MSRSEMTNIASLHEIRAVDNDLLLRKSIQALLRLGNGHSGPGITALPFSVGDTTAGSETELQAAVAGDSNVVDLPVSILDSNYYANIVRRAASGDTDRRVISDLERYLQPDNPTVWENSWVRFPRNALGPFAESVFQQDLLADKQDPKKGLRTDSHKFTFQQGGHPYIRVPVSYLLKLSLANVIGSRNGLSAAFRQSACSLLDHFLNDNTSPETYSFYVVGLHPSTGMGRAAAAEKAKRYLFAQLLLQYANKKFHLTSNGQVALVYLSPHPPIRQKKLNNCISDAFYRELFMNPCLSGWNRGEMKYEYMHLCHRVLSRSQMNAVVKLRDAGIITSNLVLLPNTSNISLANNGTHVSLGSRMLSAALADPSSGFTKVHEKYLGDLVVKIVEHFLPLFVGTYSAAPYRLDFSDFHPEKALGFLPHELDYTHLRMLWRRWRKKADLKILGYAITPFGPPWLDRMISRICGLKGDLVPDHRLIDYLVAILSTSTGPALDGHLQNSDRLKKDLTDLGIFDTKMSLYLFEKIREFESMGFSGFEGRHYSLFESFEADMGQAVSLQNLLYLLAFKYIASGRFSHDSIPNDPSCESERRQIVFGAAIGIPTFFVRQDTSNELMRRIIEITAGVRASRRYPGYHRVHNLEYRRALLQIIREDARDVIEMLDMNETLDDLSLRLDDPDHCAAIGKLMQGILRKGNARSALSVTADEFNGAVEAYYRSELRIRHMREALTFIREDAASLENRDVPNHQDIHESVRGILKDKDISHFISMAEPEVLAANASEDILEKMICLMIVGILAERHGALSFGDTAPSRTLYAAPVY